MPLSMKNCLGSGAFATVFRDGDRVLKLFKKRSFNEHDKGHGEFEEGMRRAVFQSEVDAYTIAMNVPAIRPFVAEFHGQTNIDQVLDENDKDISDKYLLDCCYVLSRVEGDQADLTFNFSQQHEHLKALAVAFAANGINHWRDGAVFNAADPALAKVIDIATRDVIREEEERLIAEGKWGSDDDYAL